MIWSTSALRVIQRHNHPISLQVKSLRCLQSASLSSFSAPRPYHAKPGQYGVPSLNQSLENYLMYAKPLVTPEQWEHTRKIVSECSSSLHMQKLQDMLAKRAKMEDNWLFDWWLNSYLGNRVPIVVNTSPCLKMRSVTFQSDQEWLTYAAGVVVGVLNYKRLLETESLKTEYFADGDAMCMEQYYALLGNCRIPGTPNDRLLVRMASPATTKNVNHICVLYRNRIYQLEFSDPITREKVSPPLLRRQLEYIVSSAQKEPPGPEVGLFTSLPRDNWSRLHSIIRQSVLNGHTLTKLERSLIVLCLDESANLPQSTTGKVDESQPYVFDKRETACAENLLHGRLINSGNRWFDKTIQFTVTRDGCVGVTFEHTPADAGAAIPMLREVYEAVNDPSISSSVRLPVFSHPKELTWLLPKSVPPEFDKARDKLQELIDSTDLQYGEFRKFGSSLLKKVEVSPDAFFQMALQLAYSRLHPDLPPPPTYETGSLRRFHLGRTDTIRTCSEESVQFTCGMKDPNLTSAERAKLLRVALNRHQEFTKDVLAGQAFDRHLLGLRLLSESLRKSGDNDFQEPEPLFTDATYTKVNEFRLSTSQVRSSDDVTVAFGPAVPDGYGVCYNIQPDRVLAHASSFRTSNESRSPTELLEHTFKGMTEMLDLLQQPQDLK